MPGWPETLRGFVAFSHDFFRRHWRRLLLIRERLRLSEEAFHIILAGLVGVIGGVTNLVYYHLSRAVQWVVFGRTGDLVHSKNRATGAGAGDRAGAHILYGFSCRAGEAGLETI